MTVCVHGVHEAALCLYAAARDAGGTPAVVDEDGQVHTYSDMAAAVLMLCQGLRWQMGDARRAGGSSVAFVAERRYATLLRYATLGELGLTALPLSPQSPPAAQQDAIARYGAWDARAPQWWRPEAEAATASAAEPQLWGPCAMSAAAHGAGGRGAPAPLVIIESSGSSGAPKGVILSRAAWLAAVEAHRDHLGWRADDRWLLSLPLAHVGALALWLRCLSARRTVVLSAPGPFDARRVHDDIVQRRVTLLSLVPTQLQRLVRIGRRAPTQVRAVLLGGAAAAPTLVQQARNLGWPVHLTYGMSETCGQVATQDSAAAQRGDMRALRPLPGVTLRCPEGRIEVKTSACMQGYWGLSEAAQPFTTDGFLRTQDCGSLTAGGCLLVQGRADDIIVTGGEKVAPVAVEAALMALPGIEQAAVFGLPHAEWGAEVVAVWVPASGDTMAPWTMAVPHGAPQPAPTAVMTALRTALRAALVTAALPRRGWMIAALPQLPTGKIDFARLRALCEASEVEG